MTISYEDFTKVEMRVGTIVDARPFPEARKPSIKLVIDFGPYGRKQSSAQLTKRYRTEGLIGKQIIAVTNFPKKKIANFESEVLVLGACPDEEDVILLNLDSKVQDGTRVL